jgi:hypothetical protein
MPLKNTKSQDRNQNLCLRGIFVFLEVLLYFFGGKTVRKFLNFLGGFLYFLGAFLI